MNTLTWVRLLRRLEPLTPITSFYLIKQEEDSKSYIASREINSIHHSKLKGYTDKMNKSREVPETVYKDLIKYAEHICKYI